MAIAVFDSGIGGLSVLQQARMLLPEKITFIMPIRRMSRTAQK